MKQTTIFSLALALTLAAHAQTNPPAESPAPATLEMAPTNAAVAATPATTTDLKLVPTNVLAAATNQIISDTQQRLLSLSECIELAFKHNLDLAIERYNPTLSIYSLSIARGAYDPVFNASAQRKYSETGDSFSFVTGTNTPGSINKNNVLSADIAGALPFGTTYDIFGNATESYGTRGGADYDSTSGNPGIGISVTQPLLRNFWMNDSRLAVAVAKNRTKYSDQGLRQQLINTVSAVENAYFELIFAQEDVKVKEKALQLAQQLFNENKKRVEVGVLAPLDEKQAESQMAGRRADLIAAQRTAETRQNTLKSLITDDYASWHDLWLLPNEPLNAIKQFYNLRDSWGRGLNDRPDLMQSKLDLEQAGIQLKYYRNQVFPQLDVIGSYGYGASGSRTVEFSDAFNNFRDHDLPFYSYGIQFSIPLGNVTARNRYKSQKVTVEQALLTLKKSEQSVMVQIDEAIKQAQSSFERVTATREAREFAEAALDAEQKKLENGKSTSFEVLSLQTDLSTAASAEIRALADYNEALTALAQVEGSTLDRRKIDVRTE